MDDLLVSVVVGTYNSARYVEETLSSIYNQDYKQLELIVADDCSTDDTLNKVKFWIKEHHNRFINCIVVESERNTGLPSNVNRGIKACNGTWIKQIAGDDLLLPKCVSTFVNFIKENPEKDVVFSRLRHFMVEKNDKVLLNISPNNSFDERIAFFNNSDAHEQYRSLLRDGCFLQAPTSFCRTELMKKNLYDEKYKFEEDYPMWLKLTRNGHKIHMILDVTVEYRRGESLTARNTDYYSRRYMETRMLFFWDRCYDYFKEENEEAGYNNYRKLLLKYELVEGITRNKKSRWNSLLVRLLEKFVDKFVRYSL